MGKISKEEILMRVLESADIMRNRIFLISEIKSVKAARENLCKHCEDKEICYHPPCRGALEYAKTLKELYIYWKIMEN